MNVFNRMQRIGYGVMLIALLGVSWSQTFTFHVDAGGRLPPDADTTKGTSIFTFTVQRPTVLTVQVVQPNPCAGNPVQLIATLYALSNRIADVNCDGVVDDADLMMVLSAFGEGC